MNRRQRLEQAFQAQGITDEARLESHILGCDLSQPVTSRTLVPGSQFQVWVRNGGTAGRFGAPIGEEPGRLGIMIENRHCETFVVRRSLIVITCTAAEFPSGLVEQVGGAGGRKQYILPPGWLEKVERLS